MDPITIGAILLAIVSGAGGQLGGQLWQGVCSMVRRPLRHREAGGDTARPLPDGARELTAFEQNPTDEKMAMALAEALVARAEAEEDFKLSLESWWQQASVLRIRSRGITNIISGGTQTGQVLQGGYFNNLTFGVPAGRPATPPPQDPDR